MAGTGVKDMVFGLDKDKEWKSMSSVHFLACSRIGLGEDVMATTGYNAFHDRRRIDVLYGLYHYIV